MKFYFIEGEDKRKQNAVKFSSLYSICHRTEFMIWDEFGFGQQGATLSGVTPNNLHLS